MGSKQWRAGETGWTNETAQVAQVLGSYGAQGRNRTTDTGIFSPLLYRLSYRGQRLRGASVCRARTGQSRSKDGAALPGLERAHRLTAAPGPDGRRWSSRRWSRRARPREKHDRASNSMPAFAPLARTCIAWRDERETMRRRGFRAGAAVLGAAPLLTKCRAHDAAASKAPADLSDWEQVRRQFSLDPAWVHMSMFFLASHPAPVKDAIEAHRRGLDENPYNYTEENIGPLERAMRAAAGEYFGCQPDDFAMTDSTTMGLGTFYGGIALPDRQESPRTTHAHPATTGALEYRAPRRGAAVRRIPLYGKMDL